MPYKIGVLTQGCRLNQSESATLKAQFSETHNFSIASKIDNADIIVIHTCMVTQAAETDLRKLLNRIKRTNPNAKIALIGCAAEIRPDDWAQNPAIKWVIGNADKMNTVQIILASLKDNQPIRSNSSIIATSFTQQWSASDSSKTRANLKIQDGCNAFCSYCIVPYARGPERSREFTDIIKEARTLAQAGHKEIVLTGIHIARYRHQNKQLPDILHALEAIPELERIRLSSIEPDDSLISEIMTLIKQSKKLCRFLHLPVQNASNRILKLMNRNYTIESASKIINQAIQIIPGIGVGIDLITGFPTESEAEFEQNLNWLQNTPISNAHIFSYSERPLTKSIHLNPKIDSKTIKARHKALQKSANEKRDNFYKAQLGQQINVLFEEKKGEYWQGFTDNYIRVRVQSNQKLKNLLKPVTLSTLQNTKTPYITGHFSFLKDIHEKHL